MSLQVPSTHVVRATATLLLLVGLAGLVGWHTHVIVLLTYGTGGTPIRYNSAVAFTLLALALLALSTGRPRLGGAAATLPLVIGVLTIAQDIAGVNLGIDRLLYAADPIAPRMSPNAAFAIALGAGAIIAMGRRPGRPPESAVAAIGAVITAIGVTAAFGYMIDLPSAFVWRGLAPLSPAGSIGTTLLGGSILALACTCPRRDGLPLPAWLPLPAGLLVMTVGVLFWQASITASVSTQHPHPIDRLLPPAILIAAGLLAVALAAVVWIALRLLQQRGALTLAETRARHEAAVLQKVLEVLPVGVWITDAAGNIISTNPAGLEIWKGAPKVGIDAYDIYKGWWPDSGRRVQAHEWTLARAVVKGEPINGEIVDIENFAGERKTTLNAAAPMIQDGHTIGAVVVVQDITDRRRMEQALIERTRDLERSNGDLEQFAYVASHDLQEPLRMVASFTQLLARRYKGQLDANADEYIGFVVDGAVRMQRLIADLLEYSRVGTRGRAIAPLEAEAAARDAVDNLAITIAESGATVTIGTLPAVNADRAQLTQVFQNLIANALKFRADDRPPRIAISATGDAEVTFTVADNGIGIEERHTGRIFDIFRRLDTSGRYPGTGLGLAICKRVVARHGGRIWVESTPGVGSLFHFTMPRAVVAGAGELLEQTA